MCTSSCSGHKKYGFNAVLEPVVNDLKVLETKGIEGPSGYVRGSIVQITGDNLGLRCLFGFVESFRARYSCRFCLTEREDYQTVFCEDEPSVTFEETHFQHCEALQSDPTLPRVWCEAPMFAKLSAVLQYIRQFFCRCSA